MYTLISRHWLRRPKPPIIASLSLQIASWFSEIILLFTSGYAIAWQGRNQWVQNHETKHVIEWSRFRAVVASEGYLNSGIYFAHTLDKVR
jgi:hypothetical protein